MNLPSEESVTHWLSNGLALLFSTALYAYSFCIKMHSDSVKNEYVYNMGENSRKSAIGNWWKLCWGSLNFFGNFSIKNWSFCENFKAGRLLNLNFVLIVQNYFEQIELLRFKRWQILLLLQKKINRTELFNDPLSSQHSNSISVLNDSTPFCHQ